MPNNSTDPKASIPFQRECDTLANQVHEQKRDQLVDLLMGDIASPTLETPAPLEDRIRPTKHFANQLQEHLASRFADQDVINAIHRLCSSACSF